jgi:hypothetical protein
METTLTQLEDTALERLALARLECFASRLADPRVEEMPALARLARHATAAAIADCLALGLGDRTLPTLTAALGYPSAEPERSGARARTA